MPFQVVSLPQASPHLRLLKILLPACTAVENRAKTKIRTQWVARMQPDLTLALKVWKLGTVPIKMPVSLSARTEWKHEPKGWMTLLPANYSLATTCEERKEKQKELMAALVICSADPSSPSLRTPLNDSAFLVLNKGPGFPIVINSYC